MRIALLVAPLALLTLSACAPEGTPIAYRSTFDGRTQGLVLHESGDAGHAGMFGTNCPFDTNTGRVTGDYDLPGEDEEVQDGEQTVIGEVSLAAVIPGTVYVLDKTDGTYTHVELPLDGVVEARLTWDGVVALGADCTLSWMGLDGQLRTQRSLDRCSGELESDPTSGLTLVTDVRGSLLSDGESETEALAGDLVAFDEVAQVFYVATVGQARLSALELDGSERWTVQTEGPVTALDDGGATGSAGVVLDLDEAGAVAFYDGQSGALLRYARTPSAAEDLAVSGNGEVVALVRPEQAFFYSLGD